MFGIGTKEIVVIAILVVLIFGAKKIPELARGIAEAIRHFRGLSKSDAQEPRG